jgi:hypothetical protein
MPSGEDRYSDFIRRAPIESIFWVFCWLCLFREATGSHQAGPDQCRLIFDEDILDMGYIKRDTVQHRGIFEGRVLHNGYEDRAERGPQVAALSDLHQQFMDIFEKAEAALTMSPPEESDFAKYCTSRLQSRRELTSPVIPLIIRGSRQTPSIRGRARMSPQRRKSDQVLGLKIRLDR